jgi:hypothetical protein
VSRNVVAGPRKPRATSSASSQPLLLLPLLLLPLLLLPLLLLPLLLLPLLLLPLLLLRLRSRVPAVSQLRGVVVLQDPLLPGRQGRAVLHQQSYLVLGDGHALAATLVLYLLRLQALFRGRSMRFSPLDVTRAS